MRKPTNAAAVLAVCLSAGLLAAACATDPYTRERKISNTAVGAGVGAAGGAAVGAVTADNSKERRKHMLIGAGVGALAGGGIGAYMDYQEAQLRKRLDRSGVRIARRGDDIQLIMPGHLTFAVDSYRINSEFYEVLNSVAIVLKEYGQTLIDIAGHTDSTGSAAYNQRLSTRRAHSVADYLAAQGVDARRFAVQGFGELHPVAANGTESGRSENRRVEIEISPLR